MSGEQRLGEFNVTASIGQVTASAKVSVRDARRFVYVASRFGRVAGFELNAANGQLVPLPGSPYALIGNGTPSAIGASSVNVLQRDPSTGALTSAPGDHRFTPHGGRVDPTSQFLVFQDSVIDRVRALRILADGSLDPVAQATLPMILSQSGTSFGNFFIQAGEDNSVPGNLHSFELQSGGVITHRSSLMVGESAITDVAAHRFRGRDLVTVTTSDNLVPNIGIAQLSRSGELTNFGGRVKWRKTVAPRNASLLTTRVGSLLVAGGFNSAVDNAEIHTLTLDGRLTDGQPASGHISLPNEDVGAPSGWPQMA